MNMCTLQLQVRRNHFLHYRVPLERQPWEGASVSFSPELPLQKLHEVLERKSEKELKIKKKNKKFKLFIQKHVKQTNFSP